MSLQVAFSIECQLTQIAKIFLSLLPELITNIKNKIQKNKLITSMADKGKTLVILTQEEYKHKINNFIQDKKFTKMEKNPMQQYQRMVKQVVKQCNNMIQKEDKWKYTKMNPTAPNLHATIKLRKTVSKNITQLQLPHSYNIRNSVHFLTDPQTIEINKDKRLSSFDIENMYTNIPKTEIANIVNNVMKNHRIDKTTQK
jgi:hypothetical protein